MTEGDLATPRYRIATIPGDGVGPEVVAAARRVVDAARRRFGFAVEWTEHLVGGAAIDAYGVAIRPEDVEACGDGRRDPARRGRRPEVVRPERAGPARSRRCSRCAAASGLFANLRPVTVQPALVASSPLRPELLDGVDLLIVRELTGGHLLRRARPRQPAEPRRPGRARHAAVHARARSAASSGSRSSSPRGRRRHVTRSTRRTSSRRRGCGGTVADEVARRVSRTSTLDHQLVDSCAMLLVRRPADFDVIVTENLFGDILSDEAAVLAGQPRHAAVGVARRAADGARHVRPVRADPRLRAGHRRPRHREPDRDDPVGGDAAAAVARPGRTRPRRSRRPSPRALDDGWRTADLRRPARSGRRARRRRHDRRSRRPSSIATARRRRPRDRR